MGNSRLPFQRAPDDNVINKPLICREVELQTQILKRRCRYVVPHELLTSFRYEQADVDLFTRAFRVTRARERT